MKKLSHLKVAGFSAIATMVVLSIFWEKFFVSGVQFEYISFQLMMFIIGISILFTYLLSKSIAHVGKGGFSFSPLLSCIISGAFVTVFVSFFTQSIPGQYAPHSVFYLHTFVLQALIVIGVACVATLIYELPLWKKK